MTDVGKKVVWGTLMDQAGRTPSKTECFSMIQLDRDEKTGKIKPVAKKVCEQVEAPESLMI